MGVMIDDLVTRGTREPYRMFTSRAEYRLMLREDNADLRLMAIGHDLGLIDGDTLKDVRKRQKMIGQEIERIRHAVVRPTETVNAYLSAQHSQPIKTGVQMDQLLKRAELNYKAVDAMAPGPGPLPESVTRQVEIEIKYEGYIQRQFREIERFKDMERLKIPLDFDFSGVHGLSNELKEKLSEIQPVSLGQASRVEGITPAALSVLMVALKARSSGPRV